MDYFVISFSQRLLNQNYGKFQCSKCDSRFANISGVIWQCKSFNFRQFYLHFSFPLKRCLIRLKENAEGCYLNAPTFFANEFIFGNALAKMEGTETANVTASGMGNYFYLASNLQKWSIVCQNNLRRNVCIYENFLPPLSKLKTSFVDITDLEK